MRRLLLSAVLLLAMSAQASAHAMLIHASPGAGTMVKAPKTVVLDFSEGLEPALTAMTVTDAAGHDMTAAPSAAKGMEMSVALKPLAAGTYVVRWHALSVDTHRTQGAFRFMVMP